MTTPAKDRMTEDEVAEYLGVAKSTIQKRWRRGAQRGPQYRKIGYNEGYYVRSEVEEFKKNNPNLAPRNKKKSDTIADDEFDWEWATPEALHKLRLVARSYAGRYNLDVDDIVSEASLYISARPDYFEKRAEGYEYERAAEKAAQSIAYARRRRGEFEQTMPDEYWSVTA